VTTPGSFSEEDKPEMSGLHLRKDKPGILVYAVDKVSPAELADIRAGM